MAKPAAREFGKRKPVKPVAAPAAPPVKRSGHVALLLMGTFAMGGGAYALSTAVSIALGTTVTIQIGAGGSASRAAGIDTWFDGANLAAVPYGGGSSVVGGVEPPSTGNYQGSVSIDLKHIDQVLEVDKVSRAARIQAGAYGPALDAQLKPHGYTIRHFPQSFEFSTLGGWIATRSGGHFATLYTHIDDFVEKNVRLLFARAGVLRGEFGKGGPHGESASPISAPSA